MTKRRSFCAGLAGAVLSSTRPAGAQPAPRKITLGLIAPGAVTWQTYVAEELNLYSRFGLDAQVVFIGSVSGAAQQLVAHSIDLADVSPTQIVQAVKGGAAMRCVYNGVATPPYRFLAQKPYKRYADLKGKLVMIGGPSDITVIFTQKMFASDGVKMGDVDFVYAGATADRYAALRSGSIAATILSPPFSFRAADEGYNVLGTLRAVMPRFPFTVCGVADDYAAANGELIVDFCKAQLSATRWLNAPANRARALDILVQRTHVSLAQAAKSYDELVVQDKAFPNDGATTAPEFAQVLDAMVQLKLIAPPLPPPTTFFDNRYVERASAELARSG